MLINKLNNLIFLINQTKSLNKNFFFILKTPELLQIIKILQEERCVNFYKIIKKTDNKTYLQIYINNHANFELFSLASNYQQYFFKIHFLQKYVFSTIRLKLFLNTKNGILRDFDAIKQNLGGTPLFGIKYL